MSHNPPDHPHHETMIQHHGPVETAPVAGHEDTKFEATDARVGIIIFSLIVIVLTVFISGLIVIPIHKILANVNPPGNLPSPVAPWRVVPPKPVLQTHPWNELPQLLAAQNNQLNSYGKNAAGQPHIPITQAIDSVAGQLPLRPNAPEGYQVPGGQGRDFSMGLSAMPPAYQQTMQQAQSPSATQGPAIQGEIRKNAKK